MIKIWKKWNRIAKIKVLILLIVGILSTASSSYKISYDSIGIASGITLLVIFSIIMIVALLIVLKVLTFFRLKYFKPSWNKSPINLTQIIQDVLTSWQFFGYFFCAASLPKVIIQTFIVEQVRAENVLMFAFGLSLIISVWISPRIVKFIDTID